MKEIIARLTHFKKTIATMESCTGGCLVNSITNIEGASEVLKFSAITYSNEYKIKMGVSSDTIEQYSVYSNETAREMAYSIASFAHANYGIGITGKLNRVDKYNLKGADNVVFTSIYDSDNKKYYDLTLTVDKDSRKENKEEIVNTIVNTLKEVIKEV